MKKINLFFFGTSKLGIFILKSLIKQKDFNIIGAIGKKNKKNHADKYENQLIQICRKNKIKYFKNFDEIKKNIKNNTFGIIGGYDGILREDFIKYFDKGIYNFHFGIIPNVRGCNPTIWSLLKYKQAGYTFYKINSKIDYGEIVNIGKLKITSRDNSFTIYEKLTKQASVYFKKFIIDLKKNKIYFIKNHYKKRENNYFKKYLPNNSYYSWNWKNEFINKFSKSLEFPGYKTGRTLIKSKDIYLKIKKFVNKKNIYKIKPGTILYKKNKIIKIKTKFGYVIANLEKNYNFLKIGQSFENYKEAQYPYFIHYNFLKKSLTNKLIVN